jgi:hypothetical protein
MYTVKAPNKMKKIIISVVIFALVILTVTGRLFNLKPKHSRQNTQTSSSTHKSNWVEGIKKEANKIVFPRDQVSEPEAKTLSFEGWKVTTPRLGKNQYTWFTPTTPSNEVSNWIQVGGYNSTYCHHVTTIMEFKSKTSGNITSLKFTTSGRYFLETSSGSGSFNKEVTQAVYTSLLLDSKELRFRPVDGNPVDVQVGLNTDGDIN